MSEPKVDYLDQCFEKWDSDDTKLQYHFVVENS